LYFLIISNVLNIAMNILFVRYCNSGVAGVAWATVISQFIALAACVIYSLRKYPLLRLKKEDWRYSRSFYAEHLRVGIPMAFMLTVTGAGIAVLQMVMNRFGKDAVAGASTVVPLNNFTFLPIFSVGAALSTYVAQNYGARNLRRIRDGVNLATKYTLVLTVISGVLAYVFAPFLVGLFIDGEANAAVIDYGVRNLRMNAPLYSLLALLCLFRGVMQGFGLPRSPFLSGIAEMFARGAGAFVLTFFWGYEGACLSNPLAWGSGAVFVVGAYIMTLRRFRTEGIPPLSERVANRK
jgi:Na+-driven multidrug efflux pump